MLTLVIVLNTLISLICLFVAWKVWQLRQTLAKVTQGIYAAERSTYNVLHGAPKAIANGQVGTQALRKQYIRLELQLQQLRQLLGLLLRGQILWQKRSQPRTQPRSRPQNQHQHQPPRLYRDR